MNTLDPYPVFVDCYGDLATRFSSDMSKIVPNLQVFFEKPVSEDILIERLQGRKNALVYMSYISSRVLKECPDLKTISYLSTGLATHGDLDIAEEMGVRFEGVKGYGDRAVAEHAIALAFAAIKRLTEMDRAVRSGNWGLMKTEEIQSKTIGIIGLGGIGLETAKISNALGARTIGWSRSRPHTDTPIKLLTLNEVLSQSDIISLHLPLTKETTGFIDSNALKKTKPGLILINTARAGIIDESALISYLNSGHIGHCALDVFHQEPLLMSNPLTEMKNVTLTPHSAWLTSQAIDRLLIAGLHLLKRHIAETADV